MNTMSTMTNLNELRRAILAAYHNGFCKYPSGKTVYPLSFKIMLADYVMRQPRSGLRVLDEDEAGFRLKMIKSPLVEMLPGAASPTWSSCVKKWVRQRRDGVLTADNATSVSKHVVQPSVCHKPTLAQIVSQIEELKDQEAKALELLNEAQAKLKVLKAQLIDAI